MEIMERKNLTYINTKMNLKALTKPINQPTTLHAQALLSFTINVLYHRHRSFATCVHSRSEHKDFFVPLAPTFLLVKTTGDAVSEMQSKVDYVDAGSGTYWRKWISEFSLEAALIAEEKIEEDGGSGKLLSVVVEVDVRVMDDACSIAAEFAKMDIPEPMEE